jgi:hypothetical protein
MQTKTLTPEEAIERIQHEGTREFLIGYLDLLNENQPQDRTGQRGLL